MKYIVTPQDNNIQNLPFYFALEQWVADHYKDDEYFMIWRVNPTVMLGRNQLIDNEVDINYCKNNNVQIFRRKSGGGCIYSDLGCLQFSYISSNTNTSEAFAAYMGKIADLLCSIGVNAYKSGRNDILVDGQKVAGSAFYNLGQRCVLHNSLLYCSQLEHLSKALTPSKEKLQSKGVESVRARVTNVGDYTKLSITQFIDYARKYMCKDEVLILSNEDMKEVKQIEQYLQSHDFVYGKNPKYSKVYSHRFIDVGTIQAHIELKNNIIININLVGDFFIIADIDEQIIKPLRGVEFTREAVESALCGVNMQGVIRNLSLNQFLRLLFGRPPHLSKPDWLKISLTNTRKVADTIDVLHKHKMNTICTSGLCPNRAECWANKTATFMIGGDICTRKCRFCNTKTGHPLPLDPLEPLKVAKSVKALGLKYAVITSVDRDDLTDFGANHWTETIMAIKTNVPQTKIELLIPDFMGHKDLIHKLLELSPDVVGHNMETVERLTPTVRSKAQYKRSLDVLKIISDYGVVAKTGFMLGLGETEAEILQTMEDILNTGCKRLTMGQYLQPTSKHLPVVEYISPDKFNKYKQIALDKGFIHVESGPLVRSSYHAEKV